MKTMKYLFTRDELFVMEKKIFAKLNYNLSFPTRYQFAVYYSYHLSFNQKQENLLNYLILLSFMDYNLNFVSISQVAASAVYLVLQLTTNNNDSLFTEKLEKVLRYSEKAILDSFLRLRKLHSLIYEMSHAICNILDYYRAEEREQVGAIYALNYTDVRITNTEQIKLPRKERDYVFIEKAIILGERMVITASSAKNEQLSVPLQFSQETTMTSSSFSSSSLASSSTSSTLSSSSSSSSAGYAAVFPSAQPAKIPITVQLGLSNGLKRTASVSSQMSAITNSGTNKNNNKITATSTLSIKT
jgi:hypothetical protein